MKVRRKVFLLMQERERCRFRPIMPLDFREMRFSSDWNERKLEWFCVIFSFFRAFRIFFGSYHFLEKLIDNYYCCC